MGDTGAICASANAVNNSRWLLVHSTRAETLCEAMSTVLHPLDFDARQAAKSDERQQIARELRE